MYRVAMLMLVALNTMLQAEVQRLDELPAVGLHSLVWFVPNGKGGGVWVDGDLSLDYPSNMGQINAKRILGAQQIEWKKQDFDILFAGKREDGTLIIQFAAGLIFLTPEKNDVWQGTYTVAGAISSPILFRTSAKGLPQWQVFSGPPEVKQQ